MPRKRLSRKELTEKDEITSKLELAAMFAVDNAKPLLTGASVVVVAIAAFIGWNAYSARVEANAQMALGEVIGIFNVIDGQTDEARFNSAIEEAALVQSGFPGSQAADIAQYFAALSHEGLGNTEESDRIFRSLIDAGDESIRDNARFALAESFKKRDDVQAAISEYELLAESADFPRGAILFELGRLHESVSELDEARGYFQSLIDEYQDSPFRNEADRALRRIRIAEEVLPS